MHGMKNDSFLLQKISHRKIRKAQLYVWYIKDIKGFERTPYISVSLSLLNKYSLHKQEYRCILNKLSKTIHSIRKFRDTCSSVKEEFF